MRRLEAPDLWLRLQPELRLGTFTRESRDVGLRRRFRSELAVVEFAKPSQCLGQGLGTVAALPLACF